MTNVVFIVLVAIGVQKSYHTADGSLEILRNVSLSMKPSESAAIMGPSGSGKSTLLNILGTLERPTGGSVEIDGVDPFKLDENALAGFRNRQVGFIFQDHHLLPQCTVLENVLIPTLGSGDGADRVEHAKELIDRVGLTERTTHRPAELSGGERQRVSITRALIQNPSVVLADEPTGNLDRKTASRIVELLLQLQQDRPHVLVVVTHSASIASAFGRTLELVDGKLVPHEG